MTPPEHKGPDSKKDPDSKKGPDSEKDPDSKKGPDLKKDPDPKKGPDAPKGPKGHDHAAQRALNTPQNAMKAVATSRATIALLSPGRAWNHIAPRGEHELKGCLMYEGKPATMFHFNPADASLLPKGLHALNAGDKDALARVEERLKSIAQELSVLEGAEFREPEFCWAVPLAHQGRIVGHIKVSADGASVVPDRKACEQIERLDK